ncbi:shikimate 5-dehydrogenase [Deinococcus metallilatus]|uniref:Shikimate 5-dehydrogenase n=1 Tax=Deinococcus metallilatus TaxID=1211322 RepID=A0AAJ5K0H6_9DEIO|nr:shikimate 5-dehydrogenase [Deinococcus metallilatus]MBB5294841.1 shikimate dehydrogenase [Deinococcus metallilatus]QBY09442.1 shikimate 5-dehydrogenase [Deinococcus metallilatus]RXJ09447.1 shikimate 5-dehydrogenase [Deinococcus metallilatus]TLK28970.1 shikimate 5-dehydrogenase [Deinococcus metallilatus]GMA16768.1 shikimate 5-dehydrogenase [Deinococcus metallilatus]
MARTITKDTQLCMSLAGRPGNFGTRFHNFLYEELDLDFIYKAFTTDDLRAAIGGVRALGIRGCAVSMPFKEACIAWVDELDPSAAVIQSVNTVVNTAGWLRAYNTDYLAVASLLKVHQVPPDALFALRGSGGMAKAVAAALRDAGFRQGVILARNQAAGEALAHSCGFRWQAELGPLRPDVLINATPLGMAGGEEAQALAFPPEVVASADTVFDVVALPAETPLIRLAREQGQRVITGAEVIALQAAEQFVLYTGVRPSAEQVRRAAAFAATG